ncbi:MAG: alpha/beta fold hydrolase [bacterium]|nr:alpha/beta fold hydrolase [bacterium]
MTTGLCQDLLMAMANRIHYEICGDGVPVLVMHGGLGLDHQYLRPALDDLAGSAELVFYDHRGNGRSAPVEDWGQVTLESLADDADALRQALGFDRIVLYGHSYGGFVAITYALRHQRRLSGLILAGTAANLRHPPNIPPDADPDAVAAFGALFSGPMGSDGEWAETWSRALPLYWPEMDRDTAADIHRRTIYRADAWNRSGPALAGYDVLDEMARIDVPVLLVCGRRDFLCGPAPYEDMHAVLPRSELVILEDSGHFSFLSERERHREAVTGWLAAL